MQVILTITHISVYIYIYICIYLSLSLSLSAARSLSFFTFVYTHVPIYTHIHIHIYTHIYTHTYIHTYIYIHTYTYMHTYIYIYMVARGWVSRPGHTADISNKAAWAHSLGSGSEIKHPQQLRPPKYPYGCFQKLGFPFVRVLIIRALLFGVYNQALDCWKLLCDPWLPCIGTKGHYSLLQA